MIRIRLLLLPLILFLASCSGTPDIEIPEEIASLENLTVISASVEEVPELNPERVARFGDTDEVIIGRMGRVAVDDQGRVYIADGNRYVIHVYEPDGSHLTEIGGEGDGPGEFRRISWVQPHGEFLHVLDGSSLRISRFSLDDYQFVDDVVIPYEMNAEGGYLQYPGTFSVLNPDTYLIHFGVGYSTGGDSAEKPRIGGRVLKREEGNFEEGTVYTFPASEALVRRGEGSVHIMSTDYNRKSHISFDGDNTIIHGWTDDLLFKMHDTNGSYRQAIYVPYQNTSLSRTDVLAEYADREEPWISMVRNDDMPETWPAFDDMLTDDEGRIWVSLFTEDPDTYTWLVLDPESEEAAGKVIRPREWSIIDVRDGFLYARETDEETGLVEVVKYGISLES
ncbi:6-bladed beta-propeller [Rhodohalobacter mucosus]|uniref:6-bladed beta-propeller protein n=1 Tax=Rhodohalobacter mucosus TaxID=2079485 RepID=A0A316TSA2_9BACT|nr:6-bladed beta-propeller [Rhodohalobacter mucosus]PWN05102.1 hypothetical protein DDZ15_16235 [Rhodohalobacter mucosus]